MVAVREATSADIEGVTEALTRAFADDPLMAYMLPRAPKRPKQLRVFFRTDLKRSLRVGKAYTTEAGAAQGGAIWSAPGKWRQSGVELLRGFPTLVAFGRDTKRALDLLAKVEKVHPEEPHWYLAVLGTDPQHQGKGVGSALLQPILDRCDEEGIGAYLESSKDSNIPFYRRHGFEVTGEVAMEDGPSAWPMWRDPR